MELRAKMAGLSTAGMVCIRFSQRLWPAWLIMDVASIQLWVQLVCRDIVTISIVLFVQIRQA
jgi:hypothetical protein